MRTSLSDFGSFHIGEKTALSDPMKNAVLAFGAAADLRSRGAIRNAAKRFRRFPAQLDVKIENGLSYLEPRELVQRCEAAVERADRPCARVQIVPVTRINARGALLMARWLRRYSDQLQAAA